MTLEIRQRLAFVLCMLFIAMHTPTLLFAQTSVKSKPLHQLFDDYYEEQLKLFPLSATVIGDNRYNDLLPNYGSASFLKARHEFYTKYQNLLKKFDYRTLDNQDKISYAILMDMINRELGGEKFHFEYIPVTQMSSIPLFMGILGSGTGAQPFKTVKDYDNWLKRIAAFPLWVDTAIANFRKGIKAGVVLPKAIVVKMMPQMESLAQTDSAKSIFYGPVRNFPKDFSQQDKARLTASYHAAITHQLIPAYQKLKDFLSNEYLLHARTTSGISSLPGGNDMYKYCIYYNTTTHKTPEEIYQTGLREVDRITGEMERIKDSIGFKGSIKDLFQFMKTDPQFMPFTTVDAVLNGYRALQHKIEPHLKDFFGEFPKASFEIKKVEDFRAASQSPQYMSASFDGTRPGVFYIPVVNPTKINITGFAMEALFLHEAIPGHYYQLSLQQENEALPKFRRFSHNAAFTEGWGLYAESLGEKLGCYTNPYQKLGALGSEIHRAIRLVVDVAIHTGKMTREEAIQYMTDHEAVSVENATMEIERYMADPGQALAYKIGEIKIKDLRDKYQKQLGMKFSLKNFHDAILAEGSMPLDVMESYMDEWAETQK